MEGGGEVKLEGDLKDALHRTKLVCRIYLDEEEEDLVARFEFRYGEEAIAALAEEEAGAKKPMLRDLVGERRMLATMKELGFVPGVDGRFYLDEDRLPEFLSSGLARLQQEVEVFCVSYCYAILKIEEGRLQVTVYGPGRKVLDCFAGEAAAEDEPAPRREGGET